MDSKDLMVHCMRVNANYMRLPAGHAGNYDSLVGLYQRMSNQLLSCATAWSVGQHCPRHEPATEAFIWAVVSWADAFGQSVNVNLVEWRQTFVRPHYDFAKFVRPACEPEPIDPVWDRTDNTIMELDVRWMKQVMLLTGKWGMLHHLGDMAALAQAKNLEYDLRAHDSTIRRAYLESDLEFFNQLFAPFDFSPVTRNQVNDFLSRAREALKA